MFGTGDCPAVGEGLWMWDFWPAELADGSRAQIAEGELWFALSSPVLYDPEDRHAVARIRKLRKAGEAWCDLGPAFPDGQTPGSREWSGSALVEGELLTLFFTAAGRRNEERTTFEQRLFASQAAIDVVTGDLGPWSEPEEIVASDGITYAPAREATGRVGTIEAFRDPAYFRDPADGSEYILFTGSLKGSRARYNGCVGVARRDTGGWRLLPPLVTADGVNNELERPHIRVLDGDYLLFWSTQAHVFAAGGGPSPTGLYGMRASSALGPYSAIRGSGLVACNPATAPAQGYSWWVSGDGWVSSFADRCDPQAPKMFAGRPAPPFKLSSAWLAECRGSDVP